MTSRKIDHTTRLIPSLPSMPKGISCYLILTSIHPKVPDSSHSNSHRVPESPLVVLGSVFLTILRNLRNLAPKDEKYTLHNMSSALGNDTRCGRCAKPYIIEFCGRGLWSAHRTGASLFTPPWTALLLPETCARNEDTTLRQ